ncbi:MAG: patatin-like phospholipase family protein [Polyangiaceae bacterium]|nr:patatin-like phospholipase family protein [Polyangiaceae bacterium]
MSRTTKKRRGLVFGCGGSLGHAWAVCALRRFERNTGFDPRSADVVVGTSAGSVLASMVGAGIGSDELLQRLEAALDASQRIAGGTRDHLPPLPGARPLSLGLFAQGLLGRRPPLVGLTGLLPAGRATGLAVEEPVASLETVSGWVRHPKTWIVTIDVATGERVAFGKPGAPGATIREAVAASCAVPGWVAPVSIGGREYLDGGVVSPTSADLLLGEKLDEVIVISPLTSRHFAWPRSLGQAAERVLRVTMSRILDREVAALEARGVEVTRLEPNAHDLALMGPNFMDRRRARAVVQTWA